MRVHMQRATLGSALALVLLVGLPVGAVGDERAGAVTTEPDDIAQLMQGIEGMRRLPVNGVQMVQSGERLFFVSTNGRYAFLGPAIDLWHGERLTSLAEADRLMGRIDRTRLKLDVRDLGALDLGEGTEEVWVFLDPHCPQCAQLLDQLQALSPSQRAPYRVRLIPLGVLGKPSLATVVRLNCLAERDPAAARDALVSHVFESLSPATGTCGQGALQRALVTAQLLGITQVPFLIAPDGRLHGGVPLDLLAWLNGDAR
ncbi:hypothetical protein ThidrDRAFT_3202 [Thiorhodococcus drewsii AZ1]|uniref:Disulphide bond isomerase DsbC/G N-terminal domain-containing protein n=2 Tax=Thiorhodococcus drewsii TaxID=210408 RepID=G2E4I9_9GAMM|nr:hypothetical protein ThidrDRAFT_3202 [Thiorhodococcus drewsii AZ1]